MSAIDVQPGGPGTLVTCPACSHEHEYSGDAKAEVVRCSECGARIAFGVLVPQWVTLPTRDPRFLVVRLGDAHFLLDRDYARRAALDVLSVCPPTAAPEPAPPDPVAALLDPTS